MAKFNLENYETVEERLKVFWKDNPQGRIFTEVVHETDDGSCVTIRAFIYKDESDTNPISTGIAQETKGQGGFANTDAWVENCETSAIGRALANWKYQGSNKPRPSAEEMSKVVKEDTPKTPSKKEVAQITNDSAEKFAEDIGANKKSVGDQLNDILKEMIPNEKKMKEVKTKVYNDMVENTEVNEDVDNWTSKDMDKFLNRVEVFLEDEDIIDVVFDNDTVKTCPSCKQTGNVEDNREKKSDPKFSKIPDFACSNYGENDGCGKGWWIGNEDLPTEWI
jgi:hypothetical protein